MNEPKCRRPGLPDDECVDADDGGVEDGAEPLLLSGMYTHEPARAPEADMAAMSWSSGEAMRAMLPSMSGEGASWVGDAPAGTACAFWW